MRLPQDRILHIDTELAGDEVRVVMEWQGELVRCKYCRHYQNVSWAKEMRCVNPYWATARGTVETDFCSYGERRE